MTHIDETELSDIRKKEKDEVYELNNRLDQKIEDNIVRSEYYRNKNEYDELRD